MVSEYRKNDDKYESPENGFPIHEYSPIAGPESTLVFAEYKKPPSPRNG